MSQPQIVDINQRRPELNRAVQSIPPSGIRAFFELVVGRDDVLSLGVGEPDFCTPWRAREAAVWRINRGETSYTSNSGLLSLRKAISSYLSNRFDVHADPQHEILITVGV